MTGADLQVKALSSALAGFEIDVVVSGSIGAVESVRFIRSLRRLGAKVQPWLTEGGAQFVTPLALSWAADAPVFDRFQSRAQHISSADALVIAPASASLIGKIAAGITDTPAAALAVSAIGAKKPVIVVPNMHDSLYDSPQVTANLARLATWASVLNPRQDEGKRKFPDPRNLADNVAHAVNHSRQRHSPVLVTLGTTRGYVDDVRYFSNYSSGKLGTLIAEELYRWGIRTHVIAGPAKYTPQAATLLEHIETNEELAQRAEAALAQGCSGLVMAASVLDFIPHRVAAGKLRSTEELKVTFSKAPKLLGRLNPASALKVGFKLEVGMDRAQALVLAQRYMTEYSLSMMVLNSLEQVDENHHTALIGMRDKGGVRLLPGEFVGKEALAHLIAGHLREGLDGPGSSL